MPPKKPKLTPEERKAARAEKRAAKKKRILETKKQQKRDQLAREIKYSALTYKKQEENWRQMLISISIPEMKKDLEFAWSNFQRVIDCKDFKIELMMKELEQADEQYLLNLINHVEHIDKLIAGFDDRIRELDADYNNQINKIQEDHAKNLETTLQCSTDDQNYIKTMIYMLQVAMKDHKRNVRAEYFSRIEEEETKDQQTVQRLRAILEKLHLKLWTDTYEFLENHQLAVKKRKKEHDELKLQDDKIQKLISRQLDAIRKSHEAIQSLRRKYEESQKHLGRQLQDLQSELDFFTRAFNILKTKLDRDRNLDYNKLKILTIHFNDGRAYLETLNTKGIHILHVTETCRKLETQEEKILPFPINDYLGQMSTPNIPDAKDYIAEMTLFWQRSGKADASRYAINEEKEFLLTENEILKLRLHHYCQCLSCPNYIPFKMDSAAKRTSRNVTEGSFEVLKYRKQSTENPYAANEPEEPVKTKSEEKFTIEF